MAKRSALADYNSKRDFKKTPEPAGEVAASDGGNLFIVQKHEATRLHWDLRLEIDGVLKSWAVTKGPSHDPDIKRLAVRTEDHPMSYAEFEGVIPQDEYGGGTVMLWDRGTWDPIEGKSAKDLVDGHLHFVLNGERMKGEWLLIRLRKKPGEKRENWLLRKLNDEFAGTGDALVEREIRSIATNRSMAEIAAGKTARPKPKSKTRKKPPASSTKNNRPAPLEIERSAPLPKYRKPQLATLVDDVPTGNGWMHEIKFDGYRALIAAKGKSVKIFTRNGKDWSDKFLPLKKAFADLDLPPSLIDGEIVAHDANGNPDFSALQSMLKRGKSQQEDSDVLTFYGFDLLTLGKTDLTDLPNIERKEHLADLLTDAGPNIRVAEHVVGSGEKLLKLMCDAGQEGIISKKIDAPYRSKRTKDWRKIKCLRRDDFIIIGYKASKSRGRAFASLLMAQKVDSKLVYRGNVGTGFSASQMDELAAKLNRLARKTAPVEVDAVAARGVSWVTPKLIANVAYAELTSSGRIRHGSFLGLQEAGPKRSAKGSIPKKAKTKSAPHGVKITSADRVVFPNGNFTKGEVADYYDHLAEPMLEFLARRPVSLVRCPQGRAKKCFFQRHDSGALGDHVHAVPIAEKDGGTEDYLYVEDRTGILQCVQMGTLEFHGWGSSVDDVEKPDRMVFDLDPDEGLDFQDVKSASQLIREQLDQMGLVSFPLLSGGKGVHIIVPLTPGHDWQQHKDFSQRFAQALALAEPDRFVASMSKAKRKGKIFIDWMRNRRSSTAILPYSVRAREGAPVAAPLSWFELDDTKAANRFTIADRDLLIERSRKLEGWGIAEQVLPDL
ncbi:DNA ligase D [Erythrobacter alti]|uniref:DNA ligase D n=1 Tax=Erythrobacter alti TaxID=1896145 RepID=UPI0030F43A5E